MGDVRDGEAQRTDPRVSGARPDAGRRGQVAETLKKWQKPVIEKAKDSDGWSFHIVSFPDKKPGATTLSLVFYDVSDGSRSTSRPRT